MSDRRNEIQVNDFSLNQTAHRLVECLGRHQIKMVLAESCTCGRAVAALGTVSGVSQFLCGGLVVYRLESKSQWLGLDPAWLAEVSTESLACSQALAHAALIHTPEAQFSLAITGDLDPAASPDKQGRVFLAAAQRHGAHEEPKPCGSLEVRLQTPDRLSRQNEAAQRLLHFGLELLE